MKKGIKGSASGEEESESEFVWRAAFEEHLGVEREALARLVLRGVGFDEFVIEKDGGVRTLIEHFVGIRDVRDSEELYYETFRVIYAFFKGMGMNSVQLAHAKIVFIYIYIYKQHLSGDANYNTAMRISIYYIDWG